MVPLYSSPFAFFSHGQALMPTSYWCFCCSLPNSNSHWRASLRLCLPPRRTNGKSAERKRKSAWRNLATISGEVCVCVVRVCGLRACGCVYVACVHVGACFSSCLYARAHANVHNEQCVRVFGPENRINLNCEESINIDACFLFMWKITLC